MLSGSSASLLELAPWSLTAQFNAHSSSIVKRQGNFLTVMSSGLPADFLLVSRLAMILSRFCCSESEEDLVLLTVYFSTDSLVLGSAPTVAALGLLPTTLVVA